MFEVVYRKRLEVCAYDLCVCRDNRLYFCSIACSTVMSVDMDFEDFQVHSSDDKYHSIACDGEQMIIGTTDGRLLLWSVGTRSPVEIFRVPNATIQAVGIDSTAPLICFAAGNRIWCVSFDGDLVCEQATKMPPYDLLVLAESHEVWSVESGLEIIDIMTGFSFVFRDGPGYLNYTTISKTSHGDIACIGGGVDFFDRQGNYVESIDGDFNRGVLSPAGRLLVNEIADGDETSFRTLKSPARREIDVISDTDGFAFDALAQHLIVSKGCELLKYALR